MPLVKEDKRTCYRQWRGQLQDIHHGAEPAHRFTAFNRYLTLNHDTGNIVCC